jgi:MFS transporter, ACDE family, multidrug resistance protein
MCMTKIGKFALNSSIASLAFAMIGAIWAVYMDSFVHSAVIVGIVGAFFSLLSIISYFLFIPLIEKTDKGKLYFYSILIVLVTYILFAINRQFYIFVIIASIFVVAMALRMMAFGLIVKDNSCKRQLSRNEGIIYTLANMAYVVGPLLAAFVADRFGMNSVFTLGAVFLFISIVLFKLSGIHDGNVMKKVDNGLWSNFLAFFKDKERRLAYYIRGGITFWWALIYLFVPIYIVRNGLGIKWVGYFLFAVAVPLVLSEYYFSKAAGKKGFRRIFSQGYFIVMVLVFACFFVSNIYGVLSLLVLASFGMAMLEPTTEAYFFDISKKEECLRFYGPYKTVQDVGNLLGKLLSALLLVFLAFEYLFLMFGVVMLLMFFLALRTKKVVEKDM